MQENTSCSMENIPAAVLEEPDPARPKFDFSNSNCYTLLDPTDAVFDQCVNQAKPTKEVHPFGVSQEELDELFWASFAVKVNAQETGGEEDYAKYARKVSHDLVEYQMKKSKKKGDG
mmetsp:Transcript_37746/g.106671  ORF Transcript_37746/g.106671 Transcript_37746/m.106671 type:complete len:117 (-) Transcript_37746:266-616(-)